MFDIVGIGESDIDIYLRAAHPPARGGKVRATEIGRFPGGMIGNFCSAAARTGMRVGIVTRLGDDENGREALQDYRERGVDCAGLTVLPGGRTFHCVVHIDDTGEKSLTAVVTDCISPATGDIDFEYVRSAKRVHMNSMDHALAAYVAENLPDARISLDYEAHAEKPGFDSWRGVLEKTAVLFMNEEGVSSLCPGLPIADAAAKALDLGVGHVVVTCAEKGGHVFTPGGHHEYPAFRAPVVADTTGAGDCFNAVFLSRLLRGDAVPEAARFAAAAAALSIGKIGARSGQPTADEVREFLLKRSTQ